MPCPPPMHIVSKANPPPRRFSSCSIVVRMRTPVAPIGWPSEMPEPLTLSRSSTSASFDAPAGQDREHLHGERLVELDQVEIVETESGAREQLLHRAHRADAHRDGSQPAAAQPSRKPIGSSPSSSQAVLGDDQAGGRGVVLLAGVAGGDGAVRHRSCAARASVSAVVSARMPSSRSKTIGSPLRCGTSTGTTSSSNLPASTAAAARWWLRAANASAASR